MGGRIRVKTSENLNSNLRYNTDVVNPKLWLTLIKWTLFV